MAFADFGPGGLPHKCDIYRESETILNGVDVINGYARVITSMSCFFEPMRAWTMATMFGDIGGEKYAFSWGNEQLQEGDRIVWDKKPTKYFRLNKGQDDSYRADSFTTMPSYQTGNAIEENLKRAL